jgi:hypothetical protein
MEKLHIQVFYNFLHLEFLAATLNREVFYDEVYIEDAFKMFDHVCKID